VTAYMRKHPRPLHVSVNLIRSMGGHDPCIADGRGSSGQLAHLPPERLIPAPDCGMKYIPHETAYSKLKALAEGPPSCAAS